MATRDPDASREAILIAVWTLMARGGVEAVTFRRVAEHAGVSVGSVQHHFGTRYELVRASCAALVEGAQEHYETLPDNPLGRLRFVLTHAIPDNPGTRFGTAVWFAYLAKAVDDAEIARLLAETKRGTEDEVVTLLKQAGYPTRGAVAAARRLLAIADGVNARVLVGDLSGASARALIAAEFNALPLH